MFIYVMDVESRDYLITHGYNLLKDNGNSKRTVWVFENKDEHQFNTLDIPCVVSDILTF